MSGIIEKRIACFVITAIIVIQLIFLILNTRTYGGVDNITHYQIARYAFKYPGLFLDHWGKPVYTTLLAPFALLGFKAAKAFNLVVAVSTLVLVFYISRRMYPGSSVFTIIMLAFSPVYFFLMLTCLTEVLFSLFLIVAIYLFLKSKFNLSSFILSFILFIRSEGIVLFPVFALALIMKRSSRSIVYLFSGTVLYTITGYFVFGDILWLLHSFPYSAGESIYGSGSIFHYIKKSNFIFGYPFLVVLIAGLARWLREIIRKFSFRDENVILFILIAGSWLTYFAAHSYVWWKGTGSSLGLIRVMGGIIPLAALTSVKFVEFIYERSKNSYFPSGIIYLAATLQVVLLFIQNDLPLRAGPTEELIASSADYLKSNKPSGRVFYFNPLLVHYMGGDPYDTSRFNWWVEDRQRPSNSMDWGDIIVWDAHFGPNEGGVQLKDLERDPYLKKVKSFYPLEKVTVLGGYDYSVHIYKKSVRKDDTEESLSKRTEKTLGFNDYTNEHIVYADGEKIWRLDETQEYSPDITLYPGEIIRYEILEFDVLLEYRGLEELTEDEVLLILSIEDQGQSLRYDKESLITSDNDWKNFQMKIRVPAKLPDTSIIKVYVWNKDRKRLDLKKMTVKVTSY